jgi:acetylornithine deacetylase/succinyl-diaminopimelate desuccinylase-like protein
MMDTQRTWDFVEKAWVTSVIPTLREYITIPNQSPAFDPQWQQHGHMDRAVDLVTHWIQQQQVPGLTCEVIRLPGRTPLLLIEIAGDSRAGDAAESVLLYGHLDKQPPMDGWDTGLGPWTPVLRDGKLYGRGAADDGYAAFAAVTAVGALKALGLPCARCVIVIEACEESGSFDLPDYIDVLAERIGTPGLVVALDSGCGNYDQLWITCSLRGLLTATLTVSTLTEGVHSGAASGIVPSTFRVLRQILERLEAAATGTIIPRDFYVAVPDDRQRQIAETAAVLGSTVYESVPFQPGTTPVTYDVAELLLNRTWRPQLEITGAEGLPPIEKAGNVLRPFTTVKLSMRLPPTADPQAAARSLKTLVEASPPNGALVRCECSESSAGWNASPLAPWLRQSVARASLDFFGRDPCYMGEGGTIPFMSLLGRKFPQAQFLITGVLGPHSNAHGPNEFLHLATGMRVTSAVARVLHDHFVATTR